MPLDLLVLEKDKFEPLHQRRIAADNVYFRAISAGWSEALKLAFESLPDYSFFHGKDG
jgi:putative proteasome-type protease